MTNCGATSESCCTSLEVTGGTYYRTYSNHGSGLSGEADPASVSGFRLDKYEVTVGRFRQFVDVWNGGWRPSAGSGKHTHLNGGNGLTSTGGGYEPGWVTSDNSNAAPTNANLACDSSYATWATSADNNENLPINCVNWYESYAFCIWDAAFLPSEAEWEYAAAGGNQQREYPWGSTDPGTSNQYAIYGCYYPSWSPDASTLSCVGVVNIAPVGTATLGAGLWGQLDLGGNVREWNVDLFTGGNGSLCTDCANLPSFARVFRGGGFGDPTVWLRRDGNSNYMESLRDRSVGFRCARTP
jgi:sulfatase modifying factor 1